MFDNDVRALTTGQLARLVNDLRRLDPDVGDLERIDQVRLLEELASVTAAAQARVTAAFADSQRRQQLAAGVPEDRASRGIASQVALARRMSPFHAARYVGWARILTSELPRTLAALEAGVTNERRAMIIARETAWLSREHRLAVDSQMTPHVSKLGDRQVESLAKKFAYRLDPQGYVARSRGAAENRRVSLRPAPDTMSLLTGFLPVAQGVAAYAALSREADSLVGQGDSRSRGQIMADTLVERITGQSRASNVPVQVNLVMTDRSLFGIGTDAERDEPADLIGVGSVPAELARRLVGDVDAETEMWVRRLYAAADSGQLVSMDSRSRLFGGKQREFLLLRDQVCRTPWCEAPIRHADHVVPVEHGGSTRVSNGQGLCAACNHAKQAPGWNATVAPARAGDKHRVVLTTPTGHSYASEPPDPPGSVPKRSLIEFQFRELLVAA